MLQFKAFPMRSTSPGSICQLPFLVRSGTSRSCFASALAKGLPAWIRSTRILPSSAVCSEPSRVGFNWPTTSKDCPSSRFHAACLLQLSGTAKLVRSTNCPLFSMCASRKRWPEKQPASTGRIIAAIPKRSGLAGPALFADSWLSWVMDSLFLELGWTARTKRATAPLVAAIQEVGIYPNIGAFSIDLGPFPKRPYALIR
jgi:hypothetical protein